MKLQFNFSIFLENMLLQMREMIPLEQIEDLCFVIIYNIFNKMIIETKKAK